MLRTFFASVGALLLVLLAVMVLFNVEIYRKQTLERSFSSFVSLQPANEYVIARLTNAETFELHEFKWVLGDYPIGDTRATMTLPATYHYFIKPEELQFSLEGEVLHLRAKALYLQTPVAFDTQHMSGDGDKNWFGRAVDAVMQELGRSVTPKLEERGRAHLPLARQQAYAALAENVHGFLQNIGQDKFYTEIVVSFADTESASEQHFQFPSGGTLHWWLGDQLIWVE